MDLSQVKEPVWRLPDENSQILRKDAPGEAIDWLRLSSWSLEDACKLITVASPDTYNRMAEYGPHQEPGTWGRDQFESMDFVYCKAKSIANSNVATKHILNPDTPENWIAWALNNGYSTDHLLLEPIVSNLQVASKDCNDKCTLKVFGNQIALAEKLLKSKGFGKKAVSGVLTTVPDYPLPVTTGDVAFAFDGLHNWSEKQWKKPLGDKPKWLAACVLTPGARGKSETGWNPVLIGAALVHNQLAKANSVRARFQSKPQLKPWLDAWKNYEADNFPAK